MTDTPQDDQSNINPYTRKRGRRGKSGWLFVVGFVVMSLVLYVLFIWIASAFGTGPSNYFR